MSRESVLIAEDDRMTRRILEHLFDSNPALAKRQFRLLMAADGREALHLFHRNSPVLVIVDLFMPRVDGFQVCRSIRQTEEGTVTPIIVTSAVWKQPDILETLRNDYGAEFMAKPFQVEDLAALVLRMLGEPRAPREDELETTVR
jgi:DNA-binding response OmpR family regulator